MKSASITKNKYEATSPSELYRQLGDRGLKIFSWQDAPGTTYSPHSHDHDEVIVVYRGSIIFTIDGVEHEIAAGDELLLPAHTVHSAINRGSEAVLYYICNH